MEEVRGSVAQKSKRPPAISILLDFRFWQIVLQKSKAAGSRFFAKKRNGKQSPVRIGAIAFSKSPVSLALGDEVPHIFT